MKLAISSLAIIVLLAASSVSADKAPRKLRGAATDAVDGKQRRLKAKSGKDGDKGRSGNGSRKGSTGMNSGTIAAMGDISSLLAMLADIGPLGGGAPPNFSSTGGAELSKEVDSGTPATAPGVWTPGAQGSTTNVQKVTPEDSTQGSPADAVDPPVDPAMDPADLAMDPAGSSGTTQQQETQVVDSPPDQGTTQIITVPSVSQGYPVGDCRKSISSLPEKGDPGMLGKDQHCISSCECQEKCCIWWRTGFGFCAEQRDDKPGRASYGIGNMQCMPMPSQ